MERRTALRRKILGEYGSLTAFCKDIDYSRTQLSNILSCREVGGRSFWKKAQEKLGISNEEIMKYMLEGEKNEK